MKQQIIIGIKKSFVLSFGLAIITFAVAIFYVLGVGADPVSVLIDGEHNVLNLDYGTIATINNIVFLLYGLIFARKYLFIGTFITALLYGPFLNLFVSLLSGLGLESLGFLVKAGMLIPAVALLGFGIAIIISVDFGVGTLELLTLSLADFMNMKIRWVKMGLDVVFTTAGFLMGGVIGIGTLIGAFLTGPMIGFALPYTRKFAQWLKLIPLVDENKP